MKKLKVLIIDDEPDALELLTLRLQSWDYEVVQARDGQEGLEKLKIEKPDIILLDIMMPNMDGYQFCNEIKKKNLLSDIPIIIVTAKGDNIDKVIGRALGADDYVAKPFEADNLRIKMKDLLKPKE